MHRRMRENSEPFISGIMHRERRIRFSESARRDCSKVFITARPSSKSGAAANRRLRHRLLHSVNKTIFVRSSPFVFPKAKAQYVICFSIQFLIMFSKLIILLCLATSMIELFMLDLVMFMIYLFRNLIMQLPNNSTSLNPKTHTVNSALDVVKLKWHEQLCDLKLPRAKYL